VNSPIGAMGLNSGVHDAMNLGDKLARIWRGERGDELLDLYERQRRTIALDHVQAHAIGNKKLLRTRTSGAGTTTRSAEQRRPRSSHANFCCGRR
jgi:3-(3-hydroxy-phenyl)propionate hydroxylase